MKLKTLALATGFALSAMSVVGTAQATSLATSILDIRNLTFRDGGGNILDLKRFFRHQPHEHGGHIHFAKWDNPDRSKDWRRRGHRHVPHSPGYAGARIH